MGLPFEWLLVAAAAPALYAVKRWLLPRPDPLDWEAGRRAAHKQCSKGVHYYAKNGVKTYEEYVVNSRGVEILTKQWLPLDGQFKGLIFYCHGYGDNCSYLFEDVAVRLARERWAVASMDYEGHGRSQGLQALVRRFDALAQDVLEHSRTLRQQENFRGLPCFVYGESMGGAVALKTHFENPRYWDGAILLAPMCKIADNMVPPAIVVFVLKALARVLPTLKAVPTKDICEAAFRVPEKRFLGGNNPTAPKGKPRLQTAVQLLKATEEIGNRLHEVTLPLLILHGEADIVTDPAISQTLYEQATSEDKTLKLYPDSWHALIAGEPDDVVDKVFADIFSWLNERSSNKRNGLTEAYSGLNSKFGNSFEEEDAMSTVTA